MRPFSIERLMGIYSQLAIAIDGSLYALPTQKQFGMRPISRSDGYNNTIRAQFMGDVTDAMGSSITFSKKIVARTYGDTALCGNVSTLLRLGLLAVHPSWSIGKPNYVSSITKAMANEIAKSLAFNLNEYLL
mmetsp:Transcript_12532/g.18790  ORF Transcript_12532/g.18790 Transcript_12532/m.18790 type:complete len:132 (+) Transcript_12532:1769-2164(+)